MSAAERQFNPSDLTDEQVKRLAVAVAICLRDVFIEKPMTIEETAEYMNRSRKHVNTLKNQGELKAHYFPGDSRPYFLKSEILKKIKEH